MDTDVPKWMEMIVEKIAMLEILLIPRITTLEVSQLSQIVKQAIQAIFVLKTLASSKDNSR